MQRTYKVTVRLNEAERNHLNEQVKQTALKKEPYLRALIMDREIKARPPDEWPELLRQISGIANNLNQIAKTANAQRHIRQDDLDAIQLMQGQIWNRVKNI